MKRLQRVAWILILIVDVGFIAWGAGAAVSPDRLLGPGGTAILPAGFEGYSGASWSELSGGSPLIAGYVTLLFRMYGLYCVLFGFMGSAVAVTAFRRGERWAWWVLLVGNTVALVSAMTYDMDRERHRTVRADGVRRPRPRLGSACCHRSNRRSGTASSSNGLTGVPRESGGPPGVADDPRVSLQLKGESGVSRSDDDRISAPARVR